MKIIKTGTPPAPKVPDNWWVGLIVKCFSCAGEFQLEHGDRGIRPGDFNMPVVASLPGTDPAKVIATGCPTPGCGKRLIVYRDGSVSE